MGHPLSMLIIGKANISQFFNFYTRNSCKVEYEKLPTCLDYIFNFLVYLLSFLGVKLEVLMISTSRIRNQSRVKSFLILQRWMEMYS